MTQAELGDQEARRIRFSSQYPQVHFTNPLSDPDGLHGAAWGEGETRREIRKADLEVLLDELEAVFGC